MNRERNSRLVNQHRVISRVLSLLLLGFIAYGTTVEAAHTHGGSAVPSNVSGVATFSDPATDTKTGNTLLGCGDCLICQLQQHFSASLIAVPPSIAPLSVGLHIFDLTATSVHSQTTRPRAGRAPPQIS